MTDNDLALHRRVLTAFGSAFEVIIRTLAQPLYTYKVNPKWIEIKEIELVLPRLATAFDGFRLLQIGDFHMGTWMTEERFNLVIDLVLQQETDAVAITGDYVSHNVDRHQEAMIETLKKLTNTFPVYSVLGNHDHWSSADDIREIMRQSGIIELRNQVHTLNRGDAQLHLAGIDDIWEHKDDFAQVLEALPEDGCAILLSHEPDFADVSAPTGYFDLQISGHSHGGQLVLPFIGPPIRVPGGIKYPLGQYKIEDMILYTNRGLGTSTMPIRINCRPEITIFTLRAKAGQHE